MVLFGFIGVYSLVRGLSHGLPLSVMWRALAESAGFLVLSAWYFYKKRNIADYFRALEQPGGAL